MLLDAVRQLHQLAYLAVYGQAAWPAPKDVCELVWQTLGLLHVTEESSDGTIRYRYENASVELELLLACIGAVEPADIPFFLQEQGYASEEEALDVWEAKTEVEANRLLKLLVFRAYAKRFARSISRH